MGHGVDVFFSLPRLSAGTRSPWGSEVPSGRGPHVPHEREKRLDAFCKNGDDEAGESLT